MMGNDNEDKYTIAPWIRALSQINPLTAIPETYITAKADEKRKQREKIFFDELAKGKLSINQKTLEQSDLLRKIEVAMRATYRTQREEKIKMLAHLLLGSEDDSALSDIDEFEYYLTIVDELNYRELVLLSVLDRYYQELRKRDFKTDGELAKAVGEIWPEFLIEAATELSISEFEVENMLQRLASSGCFEPFRGFGSPTGGILSHTYDRIREIIRKGAERAV